MSKIYDNYKKVVEIGLGLENFNQIIVTEESIILMANYSTTFHDILLKFGFEISLGLFPEFSKSMFCKKDGITVILSLDNFK